jgi:hypothetical protein
LLRAELGLKELDQLQDLPLHVLQAGAELGAFTVSFFLFAIVLLREKVSKPLHGRVDY